MEITPPSLGSIQGGGDEKGTKIAEARFLHCHKHLSEHFGSEKKKKKYLRQVKSQGERPTESGDKSPETRCGKMWLERNIVEKSRNQKKNRAMIFSLQPEEIGGKTTGRFQFRDGEVRGCEEKLGKRQRE